MTAQIALGVLGALLLLVSSVVMVRRGLLSIRYGLGWAALAVAGAIGFPILVLASDTVEKLGFTPTGFSAGVLITFLGLICLQLSISISGIHHAVQDLAEHAGMLEQRLRQLEGRDEA